MQALQHIVCDAAQHTPLVVVVSALSGITDQLIETAQMAQQGLPAWRTEMEKMEVRHHEMIAAIITDGMLRDKLLREVDTLLEELRSLYVGVSLIRDLSRKTQDTIVSYGECLSSRIVAALLPEAEWVDARECIKTYRVNGRHTLDTELTYERVQQRLSHQPSLVVMPGFIAEDRDSQESTHLGRGGSDYTAAIVAAALSAEMLEIWTDVDGFMTADPKVIHSAYTIEALTYGEAMELSNFGAKVIYPPTIYPVCVKRIPIRVKNTFNPTAPGTLISQHATDSHKPIKGISSIRGTALITVSGLSMVGVIGVNRRIFTALAEQGVSVFLVSQASSENSTSIGVREEDVARAVKVLNEEFAAEIEDGAMYPMHVDRGLATVAIVGEHMKHQPGVAGKLFGTLGRSGISVIATAQGAAETNISFVVEGSVLRKALNVLHDAFFLSEYKELNLFVCGVGTVGSRLLEQIRQQSSELQQRSRLRLNVVGIASSKKAIYDRSGLPLERYKELLREAPEDSNAERLRQTVEGMNIFNAVFVDCTASAEVAAIYQSLLEHNVSVVAANKIAVSGAYDTYQRLKQTAMERGVTFRYETNVGAGLPIIGTINDLYRSGDRILKIEAVVSGTLNFIFSELSASCPLSAVVRRAQQEGYSEPDPRIDLSGTDVVRKLVILSREAGYRVEQADVEKHLFIPDELFEGSLEEFWERLPLLDADFEQRRKELERRGQRWRFVATVEGGHTEVALREIDASHPFYNLEGSNNVVLLTTERYKDYPMQIQGYGAGAEVTAAGVFANVMSVANI